MPKLINRANDDLRMALVALKCPNCAGTVQMEEDMKQGFCVHCGSRIMNDRSVSGNVTVDKRSDIVNALKVAKRKMEENDWNGVIRTVDSILLMDADCRDALYMHSLLKTGAKIISTKGALISKEMFDEIINSVKDEGLNNYDIFSPEDIIKYRGAHNLSISLVSKNKTMVYLLVNGEWYHLYSGSSITIGINPGTHNIAMTMTLDDDVKETTTFAANGDATFEIREAGGMFSKNKLKIVQIQ
jgi:DNA-directed RNA polymerase subunit RPC12/RpoP